MDIVGKMIIMRKDFDKNTAYSTSLRNTFDGTFKRMYIAVQLPKGHELNNFTEVNVKKGFLSFFIDTRGYEKVKAILMDYEITKEYETPDGVPTDVTNEVYEQTMVNPDDELPF